MNWWRLAILILMGSLSSCLQTENSSTFDADMYGSIGGGSPEFIAARMIFTQSCNGCHAYHTQTEAQLAASGLIVAGNPEASPIYYRLIGSSGAMGPKDMPTGGALSSAELIQIRTWIENGTF